MLKIIDKLSSYNFFNYLFPGIVFIVLAKKVTHYEFFQIDSISGVFFCYFAGLAISRCGSLIIEPFLKKVSFLNFTGYADFVAVSKKDEKLELLSEVSNTYRTLCACFLTLLLLKAYEFIEDKVSFIKSVSPILLVVLFLVIFLFSYKKQTDYITQRIKANK